LNHFENFCFKKGEEEKESQKQTKKKQKKTKKTKKKPTSFS
jgi:hypothetical protein